VSSLHNLYRRAEPRLILLGSEWSFLIPFLEAIDGIEVCIRTSMPIEIVVARVRALLPHGASNDEPLPDTRLKVDRESWRITVDDIPVPLSPTQFEILALLMSKPSRVFSRSEIIAEVWGTWFGSDHHLDVHISRIRAAIFEVGGPRLPIAVRGVGFCMRH
jgi:DNA-binding response OmpR family regulator